MTTRRSFLRALFAAPFIRQAAPAVPAFTAGGLQTFGAGSRVLLIGREEILGLDEARAIGAALGRACRQHEERALMELLR